MITIDENTLIAYVDGELDTETVRLVEDKLSRDENARKYVEHLREISALSRIAFNNTLHETVPQALKDTILNASAAKTVSNVAENVVTFTPRIKKDWKMAMPMAAAIAFLFLGLGGGYKYAQSSTQNALKLAAYTQQQDQAAMEQALNQALEVKMSGDTQTWQNPDTQHSATFTPVRTYQDKSGKFCREYRKDVTWKGRTETTFGLACRTDKGVWKTRYLIMDPTVGHSL